MIGRRVSDAILQHVTHPANVGDVLRRVALDQDQVGALAALDAAAVGEHPGVARAVLRCDADRFAGRDAGLHVELELTMEHEACQAVGSGDECHSAVVKPAKQLHHALPGLAIISSLPPLTSVELFRQARWVAKGMWSATAASDGSVSPGFWV